MPTSSTVVALLLVVCVTVLYAAAGRYNLLAHRQTDHYLKDSSQRAAVRVGRVVVGPFVLTYAATGYIGQWLTDRFSGSGSDIMQCRRAIRIVEREIRRGNLDETRGRRSELHQQLHTLRGEPGQARQVKRAQRASKLTERVLTSQPDPIAPIAVVPEPDRDRESDSTGTAGGRH